MVECDNTHAKNVPYVPPSGYTNRALDTVLAATSAAAAAAAAPAAVAAAAAAAEAAAAVDPDVAMLAMPLAIVSAAPGSGSG